MPFYLLVLKIRHRPDFLGIEDFKTLIFASRFEFPNL